MGSPEWLIEARRSPPSPLPSWLTAIPVDDPVPVKGERKELLYEQFNTVFPFVLDRVYEGLTLAAAIREIPPMSIPLDIGLFTRWIYKDPERKRAYVEAKEIRTEVWAGEVIKHSIGDETDHDVQRSKLIVDSYRWLMGADNRKVYGDSKNIEINGGISITAALEEARNRLTEIEVIADEMNVIDVAETRQIESGDDE